MGHRQQIFWLVEHEKNKRGHRALKKLYMENCETHEGIEHEKTYIWKTMRPMKAQKKKNLHMVLSQMHPNSFDTEALLYFIEFREF